MPPLVEFSGPTCCTQCGKGLGVDYTVVGLLICPDCTLELLVSRREITVPQVYTVNHEVRRSLIGTGRRAYQND